jgi:hypothetical protein
MRLGFCLVFFIVCLVSSNCFAGFNVGISYFDIRSEDKNFRYVDNKIEPNLTIGYSKAINNYVISVNTNRFNFTSKRKVADKRNKEYQLETRSNIDSIQFGYKVINFIPSIFVANASVVKNLRYNNNTVSKTKYHTLLYGVNLTIFLDKNISTSLIYVRPNKTLQTNNTFGGSINYYF